MTPRPAYGAQRLLSPPPPEAWREINVQVVRTLADFQEVVAVRAVAYMAGQNCPYEEEFDGNDFSAQHMVARLAPGRPVAALRIRWFADFAKIERVCVLPEARGKDVVKVLVAHALELVARKGYVRVVSQIQARLLPMWRHVVPARTRPGRKPFAFSDYEYVEIEVDLPEHPGRITADTDPYIVLRPEGEWDAEGVLERSADRTAGGAVAA